MKFNLQSLKKEELLLLKLSALYRQYGYKKYNMSRFEEYSLYLENSSFLQNDKIITFNDIDGKLLALKPDVTLSIVKNAKTISNQVEKVFYNEKVYRCSNKSKGFKEISQIGVDAYGNADFYTTVEVILLALQSLQAINEESVLDLSHISFVLGLIDALQIDCFNVKQEIMKCIAEKNKHDLKVIATNTNISSDLTNKLLKLIDINGSLKECLPQAKELIVNEKMAVALDELEKIYNVIKGMPYEKLISLDFSLLNDTNYYNGIIFEGYVNNAFRRVLAGGRYDKLIQKYNKNAHAIGFAIYVDELANCFKEETFFDVDILLIYNENDDSNLVINFANEFISKGKSCLVATKIPNNSKARQIYKLENNQLVEVEND